MNTSEEKDLKKFTKERQKSFTFTETTTAGW
jgi:hypothetical protein